MLPNSDLDHQKVLAEAVKNEMERRKCRSFIEFVRRAWPIVEPGVTYKHSWFIEVICEHLEAVTKGEIKRLLINIPPRHGKSTLISVLWPCWEWTVAPHQKYLCASYSGMLSIRDNVAARRLITSNWYRGLWGDVFHLTGDQNQKMRFSNDRSGYRAATSVGGTSTGEGGSRLLLDDAHSAQEAQSDALRETAVEWFDTVWSTRLNNPRTDAMITIMQRLHQKDVSGRILELGGWEHLCLPAEFDGVHRSTVLGSYDCRKKEGELLWPNQFGHEELDKLKVFLGEYGSAGQLQQQPAPVGGGIIKTVWFKLWPQDKPIPPLEYVLQSYDTAFTEKTTGDPSACSVWGIFSHDNRLNAMLLDCWGERLAYPDLRERLLSDWNSQYAGDETDPMNRARRPDVLLIEEKGSGQSLIQDLRRAKINVAAYNPGRADKKARVHVITPLLENGLVWIPESKKNKDRPVSWADGFLAQLSRFPNDEHDDYVDTMSQALRLLHDKGFLGLRTTNREDPQEQPRHKPNDRVNPYAL